MKMQLIRNATVRFNFGKVCILTDPLFAQKHTMPSFAGKSRNPLIDLPISPSEALIDVDMILLSHLHSDHFDKSAQKKLPKDIKIYCQPLNEEQLKKLGFSNVQPIENEITFKGIRIIRTEAEHGKGTVLTEMGPTSGYVLISSQEPTVYWIGDSILYERIYRTIDRFRPEVIITHSSGAVWGASKELIVMDAEQTLRICSYASASQVVAIHMDSLDHGTVSRDDLFKAKNKADASPNNLIIPEDGETLIFEMKEMRD